MPISKTLKKGTSKTPPRAWIIAVDMGYGHQRTAYPLRYLTPEEKVINANHYKGAPKIDVKTWELLRQFYEFVSKFKRTPLLGGLVFAGLNKLIKIKQFYPKRDLSKPGPFLRQIYRFIKKGWGRHLIEQLKNKKLALISTFSVPAFLAEEHNFPNEIFVVVCDADIARAWAPLHPLQSRIKYFTPNQRTTERLKLYGIKAQNIFQTGYPLPKENIGSNKMEVLKNDLSLRLVNLDPKENYRKKYYSLISRHLGKLPQKSSRPLTIMFSIGGAGAQKEIALKIMKSLNKELQTGQIKLIISAGVKAKQKDDLIKSVSYFGLDRILGKSIEIISAPSANEYFGQFNKALRKTDILWTKPSELSFYTALGLPIIIAPAIGSQEDFNKEWLLELGSGILQKNPAFTHQWLFDLLDSGWFAEAAMQGFIEAEKLGTFNIEKIIQKKQ